MLRSCYRSEKTGTRGQRGQNLVEFALLMPLFFFLLLGLIDFGRAFTYQEEITNAAREGARVAALPANQGSNTSTSPSGSLDVCTAIENEANIIPSGDWNGCSDTSPLALKSSGCLLTGSSPCLPSDGVAATCTTGYPCPNDAYVSIVQASSATTACSDFVNSNTNTSLPRASGDPIQVTIYYYFTPSTGIMGRFFSSSFHLTATACSRPEY